ncbi:hypothetical protein F5Y17DRAFT_475265, partial [Xylariaceae sp. FL0594]
CAVYPLLVALLVQITYLHGLRFPCPLYTHHLLFVTWPTPRKMSRPVSGRALGARTPYKDTLPKLQNSSISSTTSPSGDPHEHAITDDSDNEWESDDSNANGYKESDSGRAIRAEDCLSTRQPKLNITRTTSDLSTLLANESNKANEKAGRTPSPHPKGRIFGPQAQKISATRHPPLLSDKSIRQKMLQDELPPEVRENMRRERELQDFDQGNMIGRDLQPRIGHGLKIISPPEILSIRAGDII